MNVSLRKSPYVVYRNFPSGRSLLSTKRRPDPASERLPMLHEQVITFLETTIIFLLLTNAVSIIVAAFAVSIALGGNPRDTKAIVVSKTNAALATIWPGNRG
jgi:hypothetical protein